MQYLVENKEWIFSGIGVALITATLGAARWFMKRKDKGGNHQIQKSGAFSKNTQIGSINIGTQRDDK